MQKNKRVCLSDKQSFTACKTKGFAGIAIVIILVFVVVAASAASYYILKSVGITPTALDLPQKVVNLLPSPTPVAAGTVSDKTDLETLDREINSADLGETDSEINNLNSSASSL